MVKKRASNKLSSPSRARLTKSPAREKRIIYEIVVDSYNREERAMGWYYYLENELKFPFRGKCIIERSISPLKIGEKAEVLKMAPEGDCQSEMFVLIHWDNRTLGVPLSQLQSIGVDKETRQAIDDWHYWVQQGYEF